MSNRTVIRVEDIGKQYRLGIVNHATLQQDLQSWWARMRGQEDPNLRIDSFVSDPTINGRHFWALQGVTFEAREGEVLGIIGSNGAGKSTLLKILSQVTSPTQGQIKVRGRIASLLEVGTGFHPELTGRENIFLNGAILGMSKLEIRRNLDEIIDFSEVEKFIDTPVKRYSSGMYVRLAFAVAAHLDPEILVIDEVLAVGDSQFQRKCLGKMKQVGEDGRTILFVSHNMAAIRNLCPRVIWLDHGRIRADGNGHEITERYLQPSLQASNEVQLAVCLAALPEDSVLQIEAITVRQRGVFNTTLLNSEPVELEVRYRVLQRTVGLRIYFDLCDDERNILIRSFNDEEADSMSLIEPGRYVSRAIIPADLLAPRAYELGVYGTIYNVRSVPPCGVNIPIFVEHSNGINRGYPNEPIRSKLLPRISWQTDMSL